MDTFTAGIEIKLVPEENLEQIRDLALAIFPGTYNHIVPDGQVEYMMDLIYSPDALRTQQEEGQVFIIIYYHGSASGFAGFSRLNDEGDFKLNKIYIDYKLQGKGLGKWLLFDVIRRVSLDGARSLILNVNRHNKAIGFYEKLGFSKLKDDLVDIGNGYFMDDFVMKIGIS